MTKSVYKTASIWKAVLDSRIRPDIEKIDSEINRLNISDVDAILVSHSHFDHAMDVGVLASKYKAKIYGSESTKNIALGSVEAQQHDEFVRSYFNEVEVGIAYPIGKYTVTFYESKHFPLEFREKKLIGSILNEPLDLPAKVSEYVEGTTYSILISHGERIILVHPSAGINDAGFNGASVDIVFLGASTPLRSDKQYLKKY